MCATLIGRSRLTVPPLVSALLIQLSSATREAVPDDAVCDIQCFYCAHIFLAAERFVLCEKCEGFVSCEACWRLKKDMFWLLKMQIQRLGEDRPRKHKLWGRLHEHEFDMEHADWREPDLLHFAKYTFQELYDLREREAEFVAQQQQALALEASAAPPAAQRQRSNSGRAQVPVLAAACPLPRTSSSSRFSLSQPTTTKAGHSADTHALFRSTVQAGTTRQTLNRTATSQLVLSSFPFGTAKLTTVSHVHLALARAAPSSSSSARAANSSGSPAAAARESKQTTLLPQPILSPLTAASSSSSSSLVASIDLTTETAADSSSILLPAPASTTPFPPVWKPLMAFCARQQVQPDSGALEVRASHHVAQPLDKPCELGVFATRRILTNQSVCFYAAHRVNDAEVDRRLDSHVRHLANTHSSLDGLPTARLFRRYIARSQADVAQLLTMPATDFLPLPETLAAQQLAGLPIGCMINSPVSAAEGQHNAKSNVRVKHLPTADADGLELAEIHCLQAKCDIEAGTELLCRYNGNNEKRKFA